MILKRALEVAFLILLAIGPGGSVSCQQQAIPVAILTFQDDTGTDVSSALGPSLARDLHQKLATSAKDLLPRLISDPNAEAVRGLTIEQLAALGKQRGATFVVRGGLLAIVTSAAGSDTNVTVQLYADLISPDTSSVVGTVRAEGTGTQSGAMPPLSAIDPRSDQFSTSGLGQALGAAIAQLADAVHQTIATAATAQSSSASQTVPQPTTQSDTGQSDAAKTADADSELQQLIAQAESLISSGASTSTQSVAAVSQALSALKASLATKASLMEKNQDITAADQAVATQRQALQAALAQATNEATTTPTTSGTDSTQQPGAQKKSFMDQIDSFAGEALSLLQKIQQLRSTLQSFNDSSAPSTTSTGNSSATDPSANANNGVTTDQPLGEVSGVVTDQNGGPVAGADVSEQTSGASTTTNSSGQYDLNGLLPNQLATLVVKAGDKVLNGQATVVSGHPVTLDFQFKADGANSQTQGTVLPSTVILKSRLEQ